MAITVTVEQKKDKEISFPCLMRNVGSGMVVLFTDHTEGTCIYPGDTGNNVGTYRNTWASALGPWEPSHPITLSNA